MQNTRRESFARSLIFITCFTKENVNIDPHTISTCRLAAPPVVSLRQLEVKVGGKQKERRSQTELEQGGGGGDSKSKLCEVHISRRFKGKKRGGGRRGWVYTAEGSSGRPPTMTSSPHTDTPSCRRPLCVVIRRTAGELRGRFVAQPKFPSYNPGIYLKEWL